MIEMGLCAMQEKEGRLVGIRKEVTEMIKSRVHNLQSQVAYICILFQIHGYCYVLYKRVELPSYIQHSFLVMLLHFLCMYDIYSALLLISATN
jgi:hypothetical protein